MTTPFQISVPANEESYDEGAYLSGNPDIRAAVDAGKLASGKAHFDRFGFKEHRRMRFPVDAAREKKMRRIEPILRSDMEVVYSKGKPNFLTEHLRDEMRIISTSNISSHGYDHAIHEALKDYPGELALDCGAGRRDLYFPDVVNFEIVDYDSTDVIGVGEELPFIDNAFSVVISIAVLEHVRDPFRCASELVRVLRPGGRLVCAMPFLQPVHGYPHHYFNATPQGLARLFEDSLKIISRTIPDSLHPVRSLRWIIESWANGLSGDTREKFLDRSVRSLLEAPNEMLSQAFCQDLSLEKREELASGTLLIATKPS